MEAMLRLYGLINAPNLRRITRGRETSLWRKRHCRFPNAGQVVVETEESEGPPFYACGIAFRTGHEKQARIKGSYEPDQL